jgi:hypothetical protein
LPETTFPAPNSGLPPQHDPHGCSPSPIRLLGELTTRTPLRPFPTSTLPVASVPMRLLGHPRLGPANDLDPVPVVAGDDVDAARDAGADVGAARSVDDDAVAGVAHVLGAVGVEADVGVSTRLSGDPLPEMTTPLPFPEMTLRLEWLVPSPIWLREPLRMRTPAAPLPRSSSPVGSVPMWLPTILFARELISIPSPAKPLMASPVTML